MLQSSSERSSSFLAESHILGELTPGALYRQKGTWFDVSASRESHLLGVRGDLWAWPEKPDTAPRRPAEGHHVTCGLTMAMMMVLAPSEALRVFSIWVFIFSRRNCCLILLLSRPSYSLSGSLQPADHSAESPMPCLNSPSCLLLI